MFVQKIKLDGMQRIDSGVISYGCSKMGRKKKKKKDHHCAEMKTHDLVMFIRMKLVQQVNDACAS